MSVSSVSEDHTAFVFRGDTVQDWIGRPCRVLV